MIFTWSIADAWDWFIHVPVLGFAGLALVAVLAIAGGLELHAGHESKPGR